MIFGVIIEIGILFICIDTPGINAAFQSSTDLAALFYFTFILNGIVLLIYNEMRKHHISKILKEKIKKKEEMAEHGYEEILVAPTFFEKWFMW